MKRSLTRGFLQEGNSGNLIFRKRELKGEGKGESKGEGKREGKGESKGEGKGESKGENVLEIISQGGAFR